MTGHPPLVGLTPRTRGRRPLRTCIGCRRALPQAVLVRLVRTASGFVEPDPERRRGGRGAYLCRREGCLSETLRRSRWAKAFRAPAVAKPEAVERLRTLLRGAAESGEPVEGGW